MAITSFVSLSTGQHSSLVTQVPSFFSSSTLHTTMPMLQTTLPTPPFAFGQTNPTSVGTSEGFPQMASMPSIHFPDPVKPLSGAPVNFTATAGPSTSVGPILGGNMAPAWGLP